MQITGNPDNKLQNKLNFTKDEFLDYGKFTQKLNHIDDLLKDIIATKISDSMVLCTRWSSVNRKGSSIRTHDLKVGVRGRFEFRATSYFKETCYLFIVLGLGEATYISTSNITKGMFFSGNTAVAFLICAAFVATGSYMLKSIAAPAIFDLNEGYFWKGEKEPFKAMNSRKPKSFARLKDIHALQIIPFCHGRDSENYCTSNPLYSYELNLVLKDGNRINVICHSDRGRLCEDASTLAKGIDKPLWNVIDCTFDFYAAHQISGH
jgi:hypothetical protein